MAELIQLKWCDYLSKCAGCGKEVGELQWFQGYGYCGVCKAKVEAEQAKKEYYEEMKRKLGQ